MNNVKATMVLIAQSAILSCCLTLSAFSQRANPPDQNSSPATGHSTSAPKAPDDSKSKAVEHDGIYEVGGPVLPPKLIKAANPKWTRAAKRARLEGECVLSAVINVEGRTQDIQVRKKLGMGLDESAIEAVKKYRLKPATLNGKPVPVQIHFSVNFHMCETDSDCQQKKAAFAAAHPSST